MKDKFLKELESVLRKRLKLFSLYPSGYDKGSILVECAICFGFRVHNDLMQFVLGYCYCFKLFVAWEADISELIAWAAHLEADLIHERYEELKNE